MSSQLKGLFLFVTPMLFKNLFLAVALAVLLAVSPSHAALLSGSDTGGSTYCGQTEVGAFSSSGETSSSSYFSAADEGSAISSSITILPAQSDTHGERNALYGSLALLALGGSTLSSSSYLLPSTSPSPPIVAPVPELSSGTLAVLSLATLGLLGLRKRGGSRLRAR